MDRLKQLVAQIDAQSLPPVHLWKPDHVGDIDIKIDARGAWFHEGEVIARDKLVALFSTILWFENSQHYLVTPVEKLAIDVADVPFLIHQTELVDGVWVATTNTHEQIIIGHEHPVELRQYDGQWLPYVNVRYDLWARLNRSQYVQWVELALELQDGLNGEQAVSSKLELQSGDYSFEVAR